MFTFGFDPSFWSKCTHSSNLVDGGFPKKKQTTFGSSVSQVVRTVHTHHPVPCPPTSSKPHASTSSFIQKEKSNCSFLSLLFFLWLSQCYIVVDGCPSHWCWATILPSQVLAAIEARSNWEMTNTTKLSSDEHDGPWLMTALLTFDVICIVIIWS